MRNRRHVQRGPLVILTEEALKQGAGKAYRNLSGVEVASVERLNLLQLAPGGHLGRFCVWSKAAFERHDAKLRPAPCDQLCEVQAKARPAKSSAKFHRIKKNPLKNLGVMIKLNPYAKCVKRAKSVKKAKF